ncbi:MAG: hypothetical protein Q8N98_01935, partial [bacterium]|nr:hypothetical protein [bacterium]
MFNPARKPLTTLLGGAFALFLVVESYAITPLIFPSKELIPAEAAAVENVQSEDRGLFASALGGFSDGLTAIGEVTASLWESLIPGASQTEALPEPVVPERPFAYNPPPVAQEVVLPPAGSPRFGEAGEAGALAQAPVAIPEPEVLAQQIAVIPTPAPTPVPAAASTTVGNVGLSTLDASANNYIRNSGFEMNSTGLPQLWAYLSESTSANTFVNNEAVRAGSFALRFEVKSGGAKNLGVYQPSLSTYFGKPYTISLYIKGKSASSFTLRYGLWDRANNKRVQTKDVRFSGSFDWKRVSQTMDFRGTMTGKDWYPMLEVVGLSSGNVYIDDIQLEEGTVATLYKGSAGWQASGGVSNLADGAISIDENGNLYPSINYRGSLGIGDYRFGELKLKNATIDSSGTLTLGNDLSADELTIGGKATFNGNVDLGDTASDIITVKGVANFEATANFNTDVNMNFEAAE